MAGKQISLPRFFAIVGAVVCLVALTFFGLIHLDRTTSRMERMAEDANAALCQSMAALLRRDYSDWFARASGLPPAAMRADPQVVELHRALSEMMAKTRVAKVKIYDARGIAIFSTDAGQIGEDKSANPGFQAALAGKVASTITHRDRFDAFEQTILDRDLISSYVPLALGEGRNGVFEVYADITDFRREVNTTLAYETALLVLCFGAIYGALLYTVVAGDRALRRQYAKNLELATTVARAEAASREKSQFLANMSHELRTPLNAIIGFSEVMAGGVFGDVQPARYRDYVHDILKSGRRLLDIVSDVLDLASIEAGRVQLKTVPVDVAAQIRECLVQMQDEANRSGVDLDCELGALPENLETDPARLRQVLLNLLSNAVKFTPAGGRVVVRCKQAADTGDVAITVADTGIGIADHDIAHCLTPFGQVESAEARTRGGPGLGLPLSRRFAELLGGSLEIESRMGEGTVVSVRLPGAHPGVSRPSEAA